jgi:Fe-S-cluster-containing hydrogenase component 2
VLPRLLRGVDEWGITPAVAPPNHPAEMDPAPCQAGGICPERCQVDAIGSADDGASLVRRERCIGCGLCVSGRPSGAARRRRKAGREIVAPPDTRAEWERVRLAARDLT